MRVCKEKLGSRKALDVYELKDLQVALENIDDGLDKDLLFCQEALDAINSEDHLDDELLVVWPQSPPQPHLEDFIPSRAHRNLLGRRLQLKQYA